ncbi:MAG TPA: nucleolar RNA-binding Nop10p family protein [Candidatus Nanoarchaeia archaeon]|nr:nucleolar RNA-binding Nop10p family protein [Candidatus Nanoarchaeia archaeon]
MKRIRRCPECCSYSFRARCCAETAPVAPPKYSPEDKYAGYRRKVKGQMYQSRGLI